MTAQELKNIIKDNLITSEFLVLTYEDENSRFVTMQYIREIAACRGLRQTSVENFNELPDPKLAFMLDTDPELYVLDVETFPEAQIQPQELENVIVICTKVPKKLQPIISEYCVQIPKLKDWQIKDYIQVKWPEIDPRDIDWLYDNCQGSLYRIENELSKLLLFDTNTRNSLLDAFKDSFYSDLPNSELFKFATLLVEPTAGKRQAIVDFLSHRSSIDFDPIALTNTILNKYKQILYFNFNSGVTPEAAGLSTKQVNGIRYYNKGHTLEEVKQMITFLTKIDLRLKSNELDLPKEQLLDYIICGVYHRCQK